MKHTLIALFGLLLIPTASAMTEVLNLPFIEGQEKATQESIEDQAIFSNQCNKMAWKYTTRLKKIAQKEQRALTDAPLLVFESQKKDQSIKTLIHGKVVKKDGQQIVEITQTFLPFGTAQTMSIPVPQGSAIVSLPALGEGQALKLHISANCAKVTHSSANLPFQCGGEANVSHLKLDEENNNLKITDTSYQNNVLEHFPHIADYHQKNVGEKAKLNGAYKNGIQQCLNSENKVSFDRQVVFKKFFPHASFDEKREGNGGFGGGTTGAKVVSR